MTSLTDSIREKYEFALDQIGSASRKSGQTPNRVRLVVVTKSQPIEIVEAAIEAGVKILGENYPEEGVTKIQSLKKQSGVEWHMIGHVQSRKANLVAENFELLHSLDSVKLARRLDHFSRELGRKLPALLEFNLGGEKTKYGWDASNPAQWDDLLPDVQSILEMPNIRICGLMTMPPFGDDPEDSRRFFIDLRSLRDHLANNFPQTDWHELSMGTSGDYPVAVEEGATLVRVGTAIVGERRYKSEKDA